MQKLEEQFLRHTCKALNIDPEGFLCAPPKQLQAMSSDSTLGVGVFPNINHQPRVSPLIKDGSAVVALHDCRTSPLDSYPYECSLKTRLAIWNESLANLSTKHPELIPFRTLVALKAILAFEPNDP